MREYTATTAPSEATSVRRTVRRVSFFMLFVTGAFIGGLAAWEARTSGFQARMLSSLAEAASYDVGAGKNPDIVFPAAGPYNRRLGYTRLPEMIHRLENRDYTVTRQARYSAGMRGLTKFGISPIYREKPRAGLQVVDGGSQVFFEAEYPEKSFGSFESIPRVIMETLLFVENRDLLTPGDPRKNPAVEWPRLAKAAFAYGAEMFGPGNAVPGGSTLATQMEKFRHSPGGVTVSPIQKLQQMASASLRSYRYGIDTSRARRELVADYINSISLAALPGFGEVFGLSMGLELWYGADADRVRALLVRPEVPGADLSEKAQAFKQTLSLLLAARRPSFYLIEDRDELRERTESYVRLLADEGIISRELSYAALAIPLEFGPKREKVSRSVTAVATGDRESSRTARTKILSLLGLPNFYELDRLDLTVENTVAEERSRAVEEILKSVRDPKYSGVLGLRGERLLGNGDPADVVYSFTLYERGADYNRLRLQVDTLEGALNANEDVMLDLGSTAKLRTMATYLEVMSDLHKRYEKRSADELEEVAFHELDVLTEWAVSRLRRNPDETLGDYLAASLERRYSADPSELFYTGGGIHRFHNFDELDDKRTMSMARAFRHSVNLPFIRLMRDVVNHLMYAAANSAGEILDDKEHWAREYYLRRFADRESQLYLSRFYRKHRGKAPEESLQELIRGTGFTPRRYTVVLRATRPDLPRQEILERVVSRFENSERWAPELTDEVLADLYRDSEPSRFNAIEISHLTKLHPLEVWMVGYLIENPEASFSDALRASKEHRVVSYRWLFATTKKHHQDRRISTELEIDAFREIHRHWKHQGYPFSSLVPSYATAIGSSADRPAALSSLLGVILNDGVRQPSVRIEKFQFAEGTPFETTMKPDGDKRERVMSAEVAAALRGLMFDTVANGTGRKAHESIFDSNGNVVAVGGKTGTGDHVYKVVDAEGEIVESHVVSRAATFAFIIGDRFYGVMSAFVKGDHAADYTFTSSLATKVFRIMAPALTPLFENQYEPIEEEEDEDYDSEPVFQHIARAHANPVFKVAPWLIDENVPVTEFDLAICSAADLRPALAVEPGNGVSCDGESPITPQRFDPGTVAEDEPVALPLGDTDDLMPQDFVATPRVPADLV
jgi:membrane peptidoglycan carboxypeptidase